MNTHESYVSLETAKMLKRAGFDWGCEHCYFNDKFDEDLYEPDNFLDCTYQIAAPTLDVAQRWLREVKNISVDVFSTCYSHYEYIIRKINQSARGDSSILALTACRFYTYEEAKEASIKEALKIILEKGE